MPIPPPTDATAPQARAAQLGFALVSLGPSIWFACFVGGYALATHACDGELRAVLPWCCAAGALGSTLGLVVCVRALRDRRRAGLASVNGLVFLLGAGAMLNGYSLLLSLSLLLVSKLVLNCD